MNKIGVNRLSQRSHNDGSAIATAVQEQVFEFEAMIAELKDQQKYVSVSWKHSHSSFSSACEN